MNQTERILLLAIQKSLWNADVDFPADTDWDAVLKEADQQAVLGIVAPVAPKEAQLRWKGKLNQGIMHYIRVMHAQSSLTELFRANQIPMAILKGAAASVYYSVPSQRTMGDVDFIVPADRFDRANELLADAGYKQNPHGANRRHDSLYKDGISFEIHRRFSYADLDVERYVTEGLAHTEEREIDGMRFQMLPDTANGLTLLAHMIHHFKNSLGLRQLIDWMMYVNAVADDAFWTQKLKPAMDDTGLTEGARMAAKACQMYLGLSEGITWCRDADASLCEEMMDIMLSSGNFGRKRGDAGPFESVSAYIREKGVFRYLQFAGENNWAACHRHKWLRPFAWIYQGGRVIGKWIGSRRNGKQVRKDIRRSKRRVELYHRMNVGSAHKGGRR